jgi:type IV pilus assembly protein PilO
MEGQAFFDKIEKIKMPIRITILVCTVVVLAGALIWFVQIPKSEEIKTTTASIEEIDKQLTKAKLERAKLPEAKKQKEAVDNQFNEALKLLPNEKEIPNLLRKISELGNESDLDIKGMTYQAEKGKDFYMEIPISIEVTGTYHNIAVFFDRVGHMERIINIHNVSMRPVAERSTTLSTTCEAITYRFKGK